MQYAESVMDLVGHTPLVKISKLNPYPDNLVLAKVEYFNPGGSIKDRISKYMIEQAEKRGDLRPGGTVIEGTGAGNTGIGVVLAARSRGYRVIITSPDKISQEIIDTLRALGAEVIICPTSADHHDPANYTQVAARMAREIPGAWYVDQYNNPDNPQTHFLTTGPEILEQTDGEIDIMVVGAGTGGSITGISRFLKDKNPDIMVIGPDPADSVYLNYLASGQVVVPEGVVSQIDGIGQSFIPGVADLSQVDELLPVGDEEVMQMARRLAREEGLFVGPSSASALLAYIKYVEKYAIHEKTVVLLFPDSGNRYLTKVFSDAWMSKQGFTI